MKVTLNELLHAHLNNEYDAYESVCELTNHKNDAEVDRLLRQMYHAWDVCPTNADALCTRYEEWILDACNTITKK